MRFFTLTAIFTCLTLATVGASDLLARPDARASRAAPELSGGASEGPSKGTSERKSEGKKEDRLDVANWARYAAELSGSSEAEHDELIRSLRKMNGLEARLSLALGGPERALALDVLSALELRSLLPRLRELSLRESDYTLYLGLTSLVDARTAPEIAREYQLRITRRGVVRGPTARIAVLDALGRMNVALDADWLREEWLHSPSYEERGAALDYIQTLRQPRDRYLPLVQEAVSSPVCQLRVQARFVMRDVFPSISPATSEAGFSSDCIPALELVSRPSPLEVHIAWGYKDARPARFVADRYEMSSFIERLQAPCAAPESNACGFSRSRTDASLFTRELQIGVLGPIGHAYRRKSYVRLTQSSATADDRANRESAYQTWKSAMSEANFFGGFARAGAVFYNGHSRDGGGPDFAPPRLTPGGHVAYHWYKKQKPGLEKMLRELRKLGPLGVRTSQLGLYSCLSDQYFANQVKRIIPKLEVISSDHLIYYQDALDASFKQLSKLLESDPD